MYAHMAHILPHFLKNAPSRQFKLKVKTTWKVRLDSEIGLRYAFSRQVWMKKNGVMGIGNRRRKNYVMLHFSVLEWQIFRYGETCTGLEYNSSLS